MSTVDSHVHVWSDDTERWTLAPGFRRANMVPQRFAAEDLIGEMEAAGVDRAVLVQMSFYGHDNAYLLDCLHRHPGRFAGIALIDQGAADVGSRMRALKAQGVCGFRIYPRERPDRDWLETPALRSMFQVAAEENLVLCCLVDPPALACLERMCAAFPETPVVVDHAGRIGIRTPPSHEQVVQLCRLGRTANVAVKLSALYALSRAGPPYRDLQALVQRTLDAFGADRLMWGSDAPHQLAPPHGYRTSLTALTEMLSAAAAHERAAILGGTAERLFFAGRHTARAARGDGAGVPDGRQHQQGDALR